jgi:hypothetical protein
LSAEMVFVEPAWVPDVVEFAAFVLTQELVCALFNLAASVLIIVWDWSSNHCNSAALAPDCAFSRRSLMRVVSRALGSGSILL